MTGTIPQIDDNGKERVRFRSYIPRYRSRDDFFHKEQNTYVLYREGNIIVVLQEESFLEEGFFPVMKKLWSDGRIRTKETMDKTIIIVFDPVYIHKNPGYDTRAIMKKMIPIRF